MSEATDEDNDAMFLRVFLIQSGADFARWWSSLSREKRKLVAPNRLLRAPRKKSPAVPMPLFKVEDELLRLLSTADPFLETIEPHPAVVRAAEMYMEETGDVSATRVVSPSEARRLGEATVPRFEGEPLEVHDTDPIVELEDDDYVSRLTTTMLRGSDWLVDGPGKRHDKSRSPYFWQTVLARRQASIAMRKLVESDDLDVQLEAAANVVEAINMSNESSPLIDTDVMRKLAGCVGRLEGRVSSYVLYSLMGHFFGKYPPQTCVLAWKRARADALEFDLSVRENRIKLAQANAYLGSAYFLSGDLSKAINAYSKAINGDKWKPHEESNWRVMRGLACSQNLHNKERRHMTALDFRVGLAGAAPDDYMFAMSAIGMSLAALDETLDPLVGIGRGVRYLLLAHKFIHLERDVQGPDSRFVPDPPLLEKADYYYNKFFGDFWSSEQMPDQFHGYLIAYDNAQRGYKRRHAEDPVANPDLLPSDPKARKACCKCGQFDTKQMALCGRCRCVQYCSPECQRLHWEVHKKDCANFAALRSIGKPGLRTSVVAHIQYRDRTVN